MTEETQFWREVDASRTGRILWRKLGAGPEQRQFSPGAGSGRSRRNAMIASAACWGTQVVDTHIEVGRRCGSVCLLDHSFWAWPDPPEASSGSAGGKTLERERGPGSDTAGEAEDNPFLGRKLVFPSALNGHIALSLRPLWRDRAPAMSSGAWRNQRMNPSLVPGERILGTDSGHGLSLVRTKSSIVAGGPRD